MTFFMKFFGDEVKGNPLFVWEKIKKLIGDESLGVIDTPEKLEKIYVFYFSTFKWPSPTRDFRVTIDQILWDKKGNDITPDMFASLYVELSKIYESQWIETWNISARYLAYKLHWNIEIFRKEVFYGNIINTNPYFTWDGTDGSSKWQVIADSKGRYEDLLRNQLRLKYPSVSTHNQDVILIERNRMITYSNGKLVCWNTIYGTPVTNVEWLNLEELRKQGKIPYMYYMKIWASLWGRNPDFIKVSTTSPSQ